MDLQEKRILDSVHGNIYIDKQLVKNIIDTPEFQRLRRVEQTSTRSIFPSARHDRFIHSLGVYYIGTLISKQLEKTGLKIILDSIAEGLFANISTAYHIACLLHDIGHAPFSHTFEKYFGSFPINVGSKDQLKNDVLVSIRNLYNENDTPQIQEDELFNIRCDSNYHELTSALVTINEFNDIIPTSLTAYNNTEFVARMIIGCAYQHEKDNIEVQLRNCFINLLHGGIIDADRLDYVCRDVWASGYCTSSIDIERLISGLYIEKDPSTNEYEVCFHANVLNEIESVLDVKDFQVKYILNHHSVLLEQYYLEQAALKMALHFTNLQNEHDEEKALSSILCKEALSKNGVVLNKIIIDSQGPITIKHMADDDLINLIKLDNNDFYQKWSSRRYDKVALWKTRDEFFYYFRLPRITSFGDKQEFVDTIIPVLGNFGFALEDILFLKAEYKPRVELDTLKIYFPTQKMINYTQLYRENDYAQEEKDKQKVKTQIFYYVYLDSKKLPDTKEELISFKMEIMRALRNAIESKYNNT